MTYTYEEIIDSFNNKVIKRTDENGVVAWIPLDSGNIDYQAYINKDEA